MDSVILKAAARHLYPVLIVLSVVVLYRGHNLPGGGFIGGLIAASAVMLRALAVGWAEINKKKLLNPVMLIQAGLATACASAFIGPLMGKIFMKAVWIPTFYLPLLGKVKLGTPTLFDIGVYMTVLGFAVLCAKSLDANHN